MTTNLNRRRALLGLLAASGLSSHAATVIEWTSMPGSNDQKSRPADGNAQRALLYASIDKEIHCFELGLADLALKPLGTVEAIETVQFAVADRARRHLFVATSNGGPGGKAGDRHYLAAYLIDGNGTLRLRGEPRALPHRPIHLTLDKSGENLLVVFSRPAGLLVYPVSGTGEIQTPIEQATRIDPGIFPHQVRITPSGRGAVVCGRGNDASGEKPANAGSLNSFSYVRGALAPTGRIELPAGLGPRDLDFHPSLPLVYVALERGNSLAVYGLRNEVITGDPVFKVNTLADPALHRPRQRVGTVRVHPNGRFAYVPNRADKSELVSGKRVFVGGENNIAVFQLDSTTGAPTLVQHVDTQGIEARTMNIDPSGQWLIVANQTPMDVPNGTETKKVPASLVFFRIGSDGKLAAAGKHEFATQGELIWSEVMEWM